MNDVVGYNRWRIVGRSLTIWLVLIVAEVVHGILRAIAVVPIFGEFRSNQIGVFTGSAIILLIAYFTNRWIGAKQPHELLLVGLIWLVLTVTFEVLFGRFVVGFSWKRIASDYNVLNGGLMPLGLLVLFFSPMIAAKLRVHRK
jgi:hypothetical protein